MLKSIEKEGLWKWSLNMGKKKKSKILPVQRSFSQPVSENEGEDKKAHESFGTAKETQEENNCGVLCERNKAWWFEMGENTTGCKNSD